jgi:hypothetical protein
LDRQGDLERPFETLNCWGTWNGLGTSNCRETWNGWETSNGLMSRLCWCGGLVQASPGLPPRNRCPARLAVWEEPHAGPGLQVAYRAHHTGSGLAHRNPASYCVVPIAMGPSARRPQKDSEQADVWAWASAGETQFWRQRAFTKSMVTVGDAHAKHASVPAWCMQGKTPQDTLSVTGNKKIKITWFCRVGHSGKRFAFWPRKNRCTKVS